MLGLSDNELQRLNSDLSNLVNLVELDISRNGESLLVNHVYAVGNKISIGYN